MSCMGTLNMTFLHKKMKEVDSYCFLWILLLWLLVIPMIHFRIPNWFHLVVFGLVFFTRLLSFIRSVTVNFCRFWVLRINSIGLGFLLLLFFYIQTWGSEGYHLWVIDGNSSNMKPEKDAKNDARQFGILQFHFIKSALTANPCMVSSCW